MPFGDKYGMVVHVDIFMTHMRTDSVLQRSNILVNSNAVSTHFYNGLSSRKTTFTIPHISYFQF